MIKTFYEKIAAETGLAVRQVRSAAELLDGGATIPFISRYRKEATGEMDETQVAAVRDRLEQLEVLEKRRSTVLKSLEERDILTDDLKAAVESAETMSKLEDVYLPYRPKRRTRATIARERGLEPLAEKILAQDKNLSPRAEAECFINPENGVESVEDALTGARDIIAEKVSEDETARSHTRELFRREAALGSKVVPGREEEGAKFRDYFEWSEPAASAPSHRVLAVFRGENEGVLVVRVQPPEEKALDILERMFVSGSCPSSEQVLDAIRDGYKRLLSPSMETETRNELKKRADEEAIKVFTENLRELLLAPPLGEKKVLAIDPGFRTGCKIACLDAQGALRHNETIFPLQSKKQKEEAARRVLDCVGKYGIEAIAVGNGTGGRETEEFLRGLDLPREVAVVMVNESGASIYSASETARQEFPEHDVTVRGAVSIGRRLMDPLAELVKIDPKSIGVGQYQHDVDQRELKKSLDDVVTSCVNGVGVEVNTASAELLSYVSGLGPVLAKNFVARREQNGPFRSRKEFMDVPRLGPKAFEQCAGFLRIRGAANPLDASAVHPESYGVVEKMAADAGCRVADLVRDERLRAKIDLKRYVDDRVGLPTLADIMDELSRPGRDPRKKFEVFRFSEAVEKLDDLEPGMKLPGNVTNVTAFGAFVDVGVHQDGLVHISQLADRFVKHPGDVVKVNQKVEVTVLEVDAERRRISLSMKKNPKIGS